MQANATLKRHMISCRFIRFRLPIRLEPAVRLTNFLVSCGFASNSTEASTFQFFDFIFQMHDEFLRYTSFYIPHIVRHAFIIIIRKIEWQITLCLSLRRKTKTKCFCLSSSQKSICRQKKMLSKFTLSIKSTNCLVLCFCLCP